MKTLPEVVKFAVLLVGGMFVCTNVGFAAGKDGKVIFQDDRTVIIQPNTPLSKDDEKAMNKVLKEFNATVYRIETLKDGQVTKTKGKLGDMYIDHTVAAQLTEAKSAKASSKAIQVISPVDWPSGPSAPTNARKLPADESAGTAAQPAMSPSSVSAAPHPAASPSSVSAAPHAAASPSSVSTAPHPAASPSSVSKQPESSSVSKPVPGGTPTHPSQPKISAADAKRLVEKLKPILEKYSK